MRDILVSLKFAQRLQMWDKYTALLAVLYTRGQDLRGYERVMRSFKYYVEKCDETPYPHYTTLQRYILTFLSK